jgi:hypothetical protein
MSALPGGFFARGLAGRLQRKYNRQKVEARRLGGDVTPASLGRIVLPVLLSAQQRPERSARALVRLATAPPRSKPGSGSEALARRVVSVSEYVGALRSANGVTGQVGRVVRSGCLTADSRRLWRRRRSVDLARRRSRRRARHLRWPIVVSAERPQSEPVEAHRRRSRRRVSVRVSAAVRSDLDVERMCAGRRPRGPY